MRPPYAGHYAPAVNLTGRVEACHGCDRGIRAGGSCWTDDRAPGALVCGRCAMGDPAWLASRQQAAAVVDDVPPGQLSLDDA